MNEGAVAGKHKWMKTQQIPYTQTHTNNNNNNLAEHTIFSFMIHNSVTE